MGGSSLFLLAQKIISSANYVTCSNRESWIKRLKTHKIYFSESTLKKDFLPSALLPWAHIPPPSSSPAHKFNLIHTHLDSPEPQSHFHLSSKSFYLSDNDNIQVPLLNKTIKTTIIQMSVTVLYTWRNIFLVLWKPWGKKKFTLSNTF